MKKQNYAVSIVMLAIAAYVYYESCGYTVGTSAQKNPAIWPQILAATLAILSVLLIIETIFAKTPEGDPEKIRWNTPGMKKVYIMLGILVAFVVLMKIFGMLIALIPLVLAVELLMGARKPVMLAALPIGAVIFVYIFFVVIMKLTLPQPIWM